MRDDIKGLKLCGGKFTAETTLQFWGNNTQVNKKTPCALLYGRNGSGKSTIARAFRKVGGKEEKTINNVVLCDENGNEIQLTEENKSNIFVFDQDFIDNNIRIEENGLNTIVMLGNQVELDKQINKLKEELSTKKQELDNKEAILSKFDDSKNLVSPLYFKNKIDNTLKGWKR